MHKVLFTAGLSNGKTIHEEKGNFQTEEGAPTPWQRLLQFCKDNNQTITSLSLYTDDGKRWGLPSAGSNPKFRAFLDTPKPTGFRFFRRMGAEINTGQGQATQLVNRETFAVIEAQYPDYALQVWVNNQTFASWSLIIPNNGDTTHREHA